MSQAEFNTLSVGDYVIAGGNAKARGQRLLVREKLPIGIRGLDAKCDEHYLNFRTIRKIKEAPDGDQSML